MVRIMKIKIVKLYMANDVLCCFVGPIKMVGPSGHVTLTMCTCISCTANNPTSIIAVVVVDLGLNRDVSILLLHQQTSQLDYCCI